MGNSPAPNLQNQESGIPQEKTYGFLQDSHGNFSSGRLIKLMAFILSAFITLIFLIPIIIGYTISLFNPNHNMPDIPTNIVSLFQTILLGFLSIALGSEAIQKFTNH